MQKFLKILIRILHFVKSLDRVLAKFFSRTPRKCTILQKNLPRVSKNAFFSTKQGTKRFLVRKKEQKLSTKPTHYRKSCQEIQKKSKKCQESCKKFQIFFTVQDYSRSHQRFQEVTEICRTIQDLGKKIQDIFYCKVHKKVYSPIFR